MDFVLGMLLGWLLRGIHDKEKKGEALSFGNITVLQKWIVGALTVIFIVVLGSYFYSLQKSLRKYEDTNRNMQVYLDLDQITNIIWKYENSEKQLPVSLKILDSRPFLESIPKDPWGTDYEWNQEAREIRSAGKDKTLNTNDDITRRIH